MEKKTVYAFLAEFIIIVSPICSLANDFKQEYIRDFTDAASPNQYFNSDEIGL